MTPNPFSPDDAAAIRDVQMTVATLESEAHRFHREGKTSQAIHASLRAADLRRQLEQINAMARQNLFGSLGAAEATKKKKTGSTLSPEKLAILRKTEKAVLEQEKNLRNIASMLKQKKGSLKEASPDAVKTHFMLMAKAGSLYLKAAKDKKRALQTLRKRLEAFNKETSHAMPSAQRAAFDAGAKAYNQYLAKTMLSFKKPEVAAPTVKTAAVTLATKVIDQPKLVVNSTKLRAPLQPLKIQAGGKLPSNASIRLLAKKIAQKYPKPAKMPETVYASFLMGMTQRAAVHYANAKVSGQDTTAAIEAATTTVVQQDAPALVEAASSGVVIGNSTDPAVAQAITAAAPAVVQGAADAGSIPSVAPASAVEQVQTSQASAANETDDFESNTPAGSNTASSSNTSSSSGGGGGGGGGGGSFTPSESSEPASDSLEASSEGGESSEIATTDGSAGEGKSNKGFWIVAGLLTIAAVGYMATQGQRKTTPARPPRHA
jgi:hypothetical protein